MRWDAELDGGALMDVGCYCVSGSRLLAGEPERVAGGERARRRAASTARFAAALRFAGDVLATFDCGFDLPARDELEAIGSEGSLFLDDPWHSVEPLHRAARRGRQRPSASRWSATTPTGSSSRTSSAAIRGEREPRLGRADALGQARAIEALLRSAAEGRADRSWRERRCARASRATGWPAGSSTRRSSTRVDGLEVAGIVTSNAQRQARAREDHPYARRRRRGSTSSGRRSTCS